MIKRLKLTNWRSYGNVVISFEPGTTFVVATNGVGKSSLMEALRWALFGKVVRDGAAAIRIGATSAMAEVDLELPDERTLTVERSLLKKSRGMATTVSARLDGEALTPAQLDQWLGDVYRTEPTFLANLTVPEVGQQRSSLTTVDFTDHLGRFYGVDALRVAATRLIDLRKQVQASIRRTKGENSVAAKRLGELEAAAQRAAEDVSSATEKHQALVGKFNQARDRERAEAALRAWEKEQADWVEAATILTQSISRAIGLDASIENAGSLLDEQLADLGRQMESVRVQVAVAREREAALRRNDERLGSAHDDCPVCRRPLDRSTIASGHESNRRDIEAVEDEIKRQQEAEAKLIGSRRNLTEIQKRWRELRRPGSRPQVEESNDAPTSAGVLDEMVGQAMELVVSSRTKQTTVAAELTQAREADGAMKRLESLFRQEATLTVALQATETTRDELLDEIVRPLASEVNQRWKGLFPTRGDLQTAANGDITRSISGHKLPFDAFSTGEGMGAAIIVRLLATQMATGANFCWFDEPLEHLDPDVRRRVANMLSRATSGEGPLRQVVVTTYEEQLAHHLHTRDTRRVHLIDVRQAS